MNKTVLSIIVLILVIGGLFFVFKSKKSEAPVVDQNQVGTTTDQNGQVIPISTVTTTTQQTTTTSPQPVKEFTVIGKNFSFSPSTITVSKGDKVKITFKNTEGMHDFKIDEFGVATKVSQSPDTEVLEFTANKVGTFEYYCSVGTHRAMGMKGTLKVQ